jgi:glutamate-ammonia-ligase adenylyltransferase
MGTFEDQFACSLVNFFRRADPLDEPHRNDYNEPMPPYVDVSELYQTPALSVESLAKLLAPAGFANPLQAAETLIRLAVEPGERAALADALPHFLSAAAGSAGPDRVLVNLERFARNSPDAEGLFQYLSRHPRAVEIMVTLFAGSQFLTEILLRSPESFERLVEHQRLQAVKTAEAFYGEVQVTLGEADPGVNPLDVLRNWQQMELLRIGAADLLGLFDLTTATGQLSNLADALVQAALDLAAEYTRIETYGFSVLSMGKLGGRELNYSSDIDLLFVADQEAGRCTRMAERLIHTLSAVTPAGFLYRVDMRLRPWGRAGPLVTSHDGFVGYLQSSARLWEKQALLKARPIAGDLSAGQAFLGRIHSLLFDANPERVRADVHAMKQRTEEILRQKGKGWGEVKLGEGSIRDAEFVVQSLQLIHGGEHPEILSVNTLDALPRLSAAGLITLDEQRILSDGYIFFRTIENHLQMMHYQQTYSLPGDVDAIQGLARRLGFWGAGAGGRFVQRYDEHRAAVRDVYLKYLAGLELAVAEPQNADIPAHLARMDPSYAASFNPEEIQQHARMAGSLNDEQLCVVAVAPIENSDPGADRWRVTVVAYDYPGELSMITGLLFVHHLNIEEGLAFTYEAGGETSARDRQPKIVDVFTVTQVAGSDEVEKGQVWERYAIDLGALLKLAAAGKRREARGRLAEQVAESFSALPPQAGVLLPIEIEIDNDSSPTYTVLDIHAPDTRGFLYEFTNALAMNHVYIARVRVGSAGNRVHDVLYVTDEDGRKVINPARQRELRAAIVLIKHFTHLLPLAPNPESALLHFRELIGQLFQRPNWPDELASLERPEVLDALARLLGVSDFLWDDFLRMQYANLFPVVSNVETLTTARSREQLERGLEAALRSAGWVSPEDVGVEVQVETQDSAPLHHSMSGMVDALNAFKDRELFRIDMRNILGYTVDFGAFSVELTELAEVTVNAALRLCLADLEAVYGRPLLDNGRPSPLTVCALGKAGGRELGYASDIELMFVYAGNGRTDGPKSITTTEFYEKLVTAFTASIHTLHEKIFHIDLQLRPYGKAGSLAVPLDSFRRYFGPGGPAWAYERQALVKLRPIAGDGELGRRLATLRDAFVYNGEPFDITAMRAMRERQVRHLVKGGTFNAKFSPGGLVDVEYLVQGLQIQYGGRDPGLRLTNTREAMAALAEKGILSAADYTRLRKAHTFLRWLIDSLRMVRGSSKDSTVPPPGSDAFRFLARRLQYGADMERLREDLTRYAEDVREINTRLMRV